METFKHLFSKQFLFTHITTYISLADKIFFGIGIALLVVGIVAIITSYFSPNYLSKNLWKKFSSLGFTIGILLILWFGVRYENIAIFGTRAAALLVIVAGLVWLGLIVWYRFTKYRLEMDSYLKTLNKEKYLKLKKN